MHQLWLSEKKLVILFLADQLQNSTSYVSDLQEQTHDFMNRIHIIYGLVDLGRYSELKGYLTSIL